MYFKALLFLLFLPTFLFAQQLNWQQLDSLSSVQFESGKYREGLKNTQKCLTLLSSEMVLNEQLPILLKEALFVEKLGLYKKADTLIQEVLHQFRANKKTTHPQYPAALNAAGHIQMLLGNYASANRLLLQSKTVLEYEQDTLSDNYVEN